MFRFPFYGYPYNYQYYKYYNKYPTNHITYEQNEKEENSITNSTEISNTINSNSDRNCSSDSEQAIFEIFGIKLFLDDLIILGLLFLLYQQNVKDEMLYMILLLLLFS